MSTLAAILMFIVEHEELFQLIREAIQGGGVTKEQLAKAIKDSMVAASDAAMQLELGVK